MFTNPDGDWGAASFAFGCAIEPGQYTWMSMAMADGAQHLYLGLGTRHGTAGSKKDPRLAWVIPWDKWLEVERWLRPIQASLPLVVRKGLRRQIQELHLAAIPLLDEWRMIWKDGEWYFPPHHPIHELARDGLDRDLKQWRKEWKQAREALTK